jgi:pimeloyl-ACP methyl ester carboxylesterase
MAALARAARVVAVDLPGHGGSDALPGTPALPDYVAWAARVVAALDAGPVAVAGHSMGALIAAGLAVDHADSVTRVALLCPVHRRSAAARAAVLARADEIASGLAPVDAPLARWFTGDEADLRDRVAGWLADVPRAGYAAAYRAFAGGDATYADRLSAIRCPLLALTAAGDANSTPAMTQAIAAAVPRGRAVVIGGHRHMVPLTAPETVSAALMDWLAPVGAAA